MSVPFIKVWEGGVVQKMVGNHWSTLEWFIYNDNDVYDMWWLSDYIVTLICNGGIIIRLNSRRKQLRFTDKTFVASPVL